MDVMYENCPNCKNQTAMTGPSGQRCIPCGYGLMPKSQWRNTEDSKRAADFLSGRSKKQ